LLAGFAFMIYESTSESAGRAMASVRLR
jgi:hypothetical protein